MLAAKTIPSRGNEFRRRSEWRNSHRKKLALLRNAMGDSSIVEPIASSALGKCRFRRCEFDSQYWDFDRERRDMTGENPGNHDGISIVSKRPAGETPGQR